MSGLKALIKRRRELSARMDALGKELAAIDRSLFASVDKLADAFECATGEIEGTADAWAQVERQLVTFKTFREHLRSTARPYTNPYTKPFTHADQNLSLWRNLDTERGRGRPPLPESYLSSAVDPRAANIVPTFASGPELAAATVKILEAANRPMKTAEIYQALLEMGLVVKGKNPANNLSAHLSNRRDAFVPTEQGWVLRSPSLIKNENSTATESQGS